MENRNEPPITNADELLDPVIDMQDAEHVKGVLAKARTDYIDFLENYVKEMRAVHEAILASDDEAAKPAARDVIDSLDLVEDNATVMGWPTEHFSRSYNHMAELNANMRDFRRIARRSRITKLDTKALVEKVKAVQDDALRMKLAMMLSAVMQMFTRDPQMAARRKTYVKVQFVVIQFAIVTRQVPVLASLLYERYMSYHGLKM